jgi:hypothetical protein
MTEQHDNRHYRVTVTITLTAADEIDAAEQVWEAISDVCNGENGLYAASVDRVD